ncbi:tRNA (guanine(46)-N(7))-methyltransferase TrmB [Opacimonas viscosa]|uniref:tRNA (guanine(46)-N(7))-methyltransferase n=1 Tax=Opacimonas viscosa TaxID=2961944 RepID=A0AA41X6T7_9ALTE|nr:tRNA (guanine-N(7)-)-methyltransferase [Opacimonas viscosa]MCP3429644.1 tRNA (guanine-N(7)-)-methyltransferase [Opacimonas viscosa]
MGLHSGMGNSRSVETNQSGVHEDLLVTVDKYRTSEFRKPIQEHTQKAFAEVQEWLSDWPGPLIFDSCCGVGQSTSKIAKANPDARVVGLDKSALRVSKHSLYSFSEDNHIVVRADVIDFWRLAVTAKWQLAQHYMLYPNPYPKKTQLQKRWHGHPAFLSLLALGGTLVQRSNWQLYLQESAQVLEHFGKHVVINKVVDSEPFTPFERKYTASGQTCWELIAQL